MKILFCYADFPKTSLECMEWDAFAGYLECWTSTFKSETNPVDIDSVVTYILEATIHFRQCGKGA